MREKVRERGREKVGEKVGKGVSRWAGWDKKGEGNKVGVSAPSSSYDVTTFFVTNFPEDCGIQDLWRIFQRFERVVDIFIPRKRNKFGKRFAFVRFQKVHEVKVLEQKLSNVWCGLHKLITNVSKFSKGKLQKDSRNTIGLASLQVNSDSGNGVVRRGHASFAQVVKGGSCSKPGSVEGAAVNNRKEFDFVFKPSGENDSWLSKSYIGEVCDEEVVQNLQGKMFCEGLLGINSAHKPSYA